MVSISNLLTLGLIGGGILAFYKLGGASGIGSRIGGGFSSLFESFAKGISPLTEAHERGVENLQNPALNPLLVAGAELEAALTPDPNLAEGRFEPAAGDPPYDPYNPYANDGSSDAATTVNTGGFIQQDDNSITKPFPPTQYFPVGSASPTWNYQNVVMEGGVILTSPTPIPNNSGGSKGGVTSGGRSPSAPSPHSSKTSSTPSSTPSSSSSTAGQTGGSDGGKTGGTQPSSRQGTYSGGRR
jgi:hypothetical protein